MEQSKIIDTLETYQRPLTKVDSSPVIFIKIYIGKQRFNRSHINHFKIFIIVLTETRRTRFYNQPFLARILAVLSLHSLEILMDLRDSLISCLGGIDLSFKESTSR